MLLLLLLVVVVGCWLLVVGVCVGVGVGVVAVAAAAAVFTIQRNCDGFSYVLVLAFLYEDLLGLLCEGGNMGTYSGIG